MEVWKRIKEFPNYEVSDLGRVRRGVATFRHPAGRILKSSLRKDGYEQIELAKKNGQVVTRYVHVLVARTFIPNPLNLPEVNHKEGKNNAVSNLEWRSSTGNHQHSAKHDLKGDGVYYQKSTRKWVAHYSPALNSPLYLGSFGTYKAAKAVRDAAIATVPDTL